MKKLSGEWKFLLTFSAIVVALIIITGIFAPNREDRDPTPGTWNSGAAGAKAAYLLLGQLGVAQATGQQSQHLQLPGAEAGQLAADGRGT